MAFTVNAFVIIIHDNLHLMTAWDEDVNSSNQLILTELLMKMRAGGCPKSVLKSLNSFYEIMKIIHKTWQPFDALSISQRLNVK